MFNSKSTNAHITQHDWAQVNRAALLRSLHAGREPQVPVAAPAVGVRMSAEMTRARFALISLAKVTYVQTGGGSTVRCTWRPCQMRRSSERCTRSIDSITR